MELAGNSRSDDLTVSTILIVDTVKANRLALVELSTGDGWRTLEADRGLSALRQLRRPIVNLNCDLVEAAEADEDAAAADLRWRVDWAHRIDRRVLASGVSTGQQVWFLSSLGVDLGVGPPLGEVRSTAGSAPLVPAGGQVSS